MNLFLRRFLRFVFLAFVNMVLLTVMIELGARIVYPQLRGGDFSWSKLRDRVQRADRAEAAIIADPLAAPAGAPALVLHPYLGYVMGPGTELITRSGELLRYSRFGFFGEDPVFMKRDDDLVVAIGGASVAGALWHQGGAILRDELGTASRFQGRTILLQSYALSGYKQPQPLNTLMYLLALGAKFDVWIELDGFNEVVLPVVENLPAGVPMIYPRGWETLARGGMPPAELLTRAKVYAEKSKREARREFLARTPLVHSGLVLACWDAADRRSEARISALLSSLSAQNDAAPSAAVNGPDVGRPVPSEDEALRQAIEIWKNSTILMSRLCAANGIAYYGFVQPNQYFKDSKTFTEEEKREALATGEYQPAAERGYPLLVETAAELRAQGVPVYDLTMIFRDEPRTVYRDTCCHLNDLGNELLARRIAETILANAPAERP